MGEDTKIDDPIKKTKKKVKKVCKCGFGWGFFGLLSLAVGIGLLVAFAQYWKDDEHWERALAYAGVAFVIVGFVLLAVGITLCVILVIVYRKMTGDHSTKTMFHPPKYEYGKAPYPQQPPFNPEPPPPSESTQMTSVDPSAPPSSDKPPANSGDVTVEISEHHKF